MHKPKDKNFVCAPLPELSQHRQAARMRWNIQQICDLRTAATVFDGVDGGLPRALIDRIQSCVLRAHEPLTLESLSVAMRILGNARVDRFRMLERACGLGRITSIFMQTLSRAEVHGLKASLARHFVATLSCVRAYRQVNSTPKADCRTLFVDVTPMRLGQHGLVEALGQNRKGSANRLMRVTMMKGDNRVSHALIRTQATAQTTVRTEADAFACAQACSTEHSHEGLFVCCPRPGTKTLPLLDPTLKPIDPVAALAQFIVHAVKAYREGNKVVVMLSDATGAVDPVLLKEALERHPLKTEVAFAYLPSVR